MNGMVATKFVPGGLAFILAAMALGTPARGETAYAIAEATGRQTLTGSVSCSAKVVNEYYCRKNETPMSCTLRCLDSGGQFVLMVRDRRYFLAGAEDRLRALAGNKATVTGLARDSVLEVTGVEKLHK